MVTVPPGVRQRSVRCHKCTEVTRCNLNRRVIQREQQRGKVSAFLGDGRQLDVDLFDISLKGVGFDISHRDIGKVRTGKTVQFQCSWNPMLLSKGRFIIRSIKGQRIGAELQS